MGFRFVEQSFGASAGDCRCAGLTVESLQPRPVRLRPYLILPGHTFFIGGFHAHHYLEYQLGPLAY